MNNSQMFSTVKTSRMYEVIISQIIELIRNGKLKPGDKLPSERKMAEMLECSRSSLREAFRVLESDGLIISKAGGGRYVQNIKAEDQNLHYKFDSINLLEKSALLYFLEARELLEPKIVELAIERATKQEIKKLDDVVIKMKEKLKNPGDKIELDSVFHLALAEMTGNFVFVSMLESNLNMIKKIREKVLMSNERYEESMKEHIKILDAVKSRDKKLAIEGTLEHLNNLKSNILENNLEKGRYYNNE